MNFHITLQPLSEDDAFGGFLLLIPGQPDGHEQGSHQGDLKVLVIKNMMRVRMIMEMMTTMMMMVMVVVTEQLHLPEPVLKSGAFVRARIYESIATVGESRVWWWADFQSGSRVLKKVF